MKSMLRWVRRGFKAQAATTPAEEQPREDTADDNTEDDHTADEESKNEALWFPSWPPPNPREILADRGIAAASTVSSIPCPRARF
jgi:hypothetical protein